MPEKPGPDVYFNFSGKPGGVSAFSERVFNSEINHVRNDLFCIVVAAVVLFLFVLFWIIFKIFYHLNFYFDNWIFYVFGFSFDIYVFVIVFTPDNHYPTNSKMAASAWFYIHHLVAIRCCSPLSTRAE